VELEGTTRELASIPGLKEAMEVVGRELQDHSLLASAFAQLFNLDIQVPLSSLHSQQAVFILSLHVSQTYPFHFISKVFDLSHLNFPWDVSQSQSLPTL
jgi:hypothetical protein